MTQSMTRYLDVPGLEIGSLQAKGFTKIRLVLII